MIDSGKLQRVARRNGIDTFYQLAKAFNARGYPCSDSMAQRWWTGANDPRLSSIDRLCEILDCELLEITRRPPKAKKVQAAK